MDGWIKLHRCMLDKTTWRSCNANQTRLLITLLLMANHSPEEWIWKGVRYQCKPGQFITSQESLMEKTGLTRQAIRSSLKKLEKVDFITIETTKTNSLITVVNWAFYQCDEKITTKKTTKQQPSNNQATTTNKNDKNDKNDKNKTIYAECVSLKESEYQKLVNDHGQAATDRIIDILNNYKMQNGKKYASDYGAINNWVIKRYREERQKSPPSALRETKINSKELYEI